MSGSIDSKKFVEVLGKLSSCSKKKDVFTCIEETFPGSDNKTISDVISVWEETKNQSLGTVNKIVDLWESTIKPREERREMMEVREVVNNRIIQNSFEVKEDIRELKELIIGMREKRGENEGMGKGRLLAIFIFILVFVISLVLWVFVYIRDIDEIGEDDKSGFDRRKRELGEKKSMIKFIEYMCIFLMIVSIIGGLYFIMI